MLASVLNATSWSKMAAGAPTIVSELRVINKKEAKKKKRETHAIYISLETWDLAVLKSKGNRAAM